VDIDHFEMEFDFSASNASQIQQVINQTGFQLNAGANSSDFFAKLRRQIFVCCQVACSRQRRGQRRSQLVTENGEKVVFGFIRSFGGHFFNVELVNLSFLLLPFLFRDNAIAVAMKKHSRCPADRCEKQDHESRGRMSSAKGRIIQPGLLHTLAHGAD